MGQFTKKPVTVEAVQFHKMGDHPAVEVGVGGGYVIEGRQGFVAVQSGDWIIAEMDGKGFYPCAPDVFAATYLPVGATDPNAMSFGGALEALKSGHRACRAGWNGKGMFLVLVPGSKGLTVDEGRPLAKAGVPVGTRFDYLPHIDMWTAQGDFVPWLASQTDMLADDWMILPASGSDSPDQAA